MARQADFRVAVLDPETAVPAGLTDGEGKPTKRRFDVYRNNVTVALVEALQTAFPVLVKLLGQQNFDRLAALHARAHPPRSPLMMHYGADMPAFLEAFEPLAHLGYLPDVARLELALRRSYHAADAAALDPARLAEMPPDDLMTCTLAFAPAVELIPSTWPLFDIWRYNTVEGATKPGTAAQSVLITRPRFDPEPHPVTQAEAAWLRAIADGANLSTAQDAAAGHDPDFDLSPLLTLLIGQGALTQITTQKH